MGLRLRLRRGAEPAAPGARTSELVWSFDQPRVVLGRGAGADVQLPDPRVSGTHATIRESGTGLVLVDEGSKNGTALDGLRLVPGRPAALRSGTVIRIGLIALEVQVGTPTPETTGVEGTAALARRLLREVLDPDGAGRRPPALRLLDGPNAGLLRPLPPPPARVRIGRSEEAEITLPDPDASRFHAEIHLDVHQEARVVDLDSKNGLRLDDRPVTQARLRDGHVLLVGRTRIAFEDLAERLVTGEAVRPEHELFDDPVPSTPAPASGGAAADPPAPDDGGDAADSSSSLDGGAASPPAPRSADFAGGGDRPAARRRRPADPPDPPGPGRSAGLGPDILVYVLASLILALSAFGLATLLAGG